MEPSQTDETSTSSHFYDFDLPLPLARRLALGKVPPPEKVRAARQEIATLGPALHLCHLSPEERDLLDVPAQQDFQMFNHGSRLFHYQHLIKFAPHFTRVSPEDMDRLSACKHNLSGLRYLLTYTREAATAGVLISLLLLTRGLRRVDEAARARSGGTARRWQRIVSQRAQGQEKTRAQAGASSPSQEPAAPPRDLSTLRAAVCQAEGYRAASERLMELVCGLHMPLQTDATYTPRCADLGVDWKRDVDVRCVSLTEAIVLELFPAVPSLVGECGVHPMSLALLLGWYQEFSLLLTLAEQYLADLADSERLFWSHTRAVIRQIHGDVVGYLCGPGDAAEQRALFYQLSFTLQQARSRPAAETLRESIRAGRRRNLERLVFVSDLAEP